MTRDTAAAWTAPKTLARVAVAGGAVALFFVAASAIDPGHTEALPALPDATTQQPASAQATDADKSLGRYQGADHAVHIVATPEGPRYTITDAAGNILETKLEDHEVYSALEAHGIEIGAPVDNAPTLMIADDPFDSLLD